MQVAKPDYSEAKIVLAMVGLPARGKSYLSNKLMRYLKVRPYHPDVRTYLPSPVARVRCPGLLSWSSGQSDGTYYRLGL